MKIGGKFLNKWTAIVGVPVVGVILGGILIFTLPDKKPERNLEAKPTAVLSQQTEAEVTPVEEAPVAPEQTPVQSETPAPAPDPKPTPTPQPELNNAIYGPSTTHSGHHAVFDRETAMSQAGISSSDYGYADMIISRHSGWHYKQDGSLTLCGRNAILESTEDWKTNPISQLRICDVKAKIAGGWKVFMKSYGL